MLGEAHATLGYAGFLSDWNWAKAEREFRRAIESPSGKADKPRHWRIRVYLSAFSLHWSIATADSQILHWRFPAALTQCRPASGRTAHPKVVCLLVYPRAGTHGELVAALNDSTRDQSLHSKFTRYLLRFDVTLLVTESRRARDDFDVRESRE